MKHTCNTRQTQRGQAMIEFGIIFILLFVVFVGGAELAATALASNKVSEAAEAAINELAQIQKQDSAGVYKLLVIQNEYLNQLDARYLKRKTDYQGDFVNDDDPRAVYDNYLEFLTKNENRNPGVGSGLDNLLDADANGDGVVDEVDYEIFLDELLGLHRDLSLSRLLSSTDLNWDTNANGLIENTPGNIEIRFPEWDINQDNTLSALEVSNQDWDTNIDGSDAANVVSNDEVQSALPSENKYKALILIRQLEIINDSVPIADHGVGTIQRAGCNVVGATTDYEYGLPNRFVDAEKYPEYAVADPEVYLFHPLPIDLASCVGNDPNRGGRSRMSILVSGYFNSAGPEELNVPGLPALNQAMYSLYSKACFNEEGQYMGCENTDPAQILLKAPGKLCLSTVEDENLDSCSVGVDNVDTAGFYYWNKNIDQVNADAPQFYPTFQLDCNPNSVTTPVVGEDGIPVFDDDCIGVPQVVRVHVRYRAIFESLIASGVQELNAADTPSYFYNPARVGAAGRINSFPGSEIGYIGANGNPTLKKFKDLRGCYELDVTSNQTSSCN